MKTKNGCLIKDDDFLKHWIKIFCAYRQSNYYKEFTGDELRDLAFIETKTFYLGLHAMRDSGECFENL